MSNTTEVPCSVADCMLIAIRRTWCEKHYRRWLKQGDPLAAVRAWCKTPEESFSIRTEWQGDCLVWTGTRDGKGYGQITVSPNTVPVHRWAYEKVHGPIPAGLLVDHMCHNRLCSNVEHLRLATNKQNMENLAGLLSNNTSGYRNVRRSRTPGKWQVEVHHHGKSHYGGQFTCIDKANEAAIALRNKLYTHNDLDREAQNPYSK